MLYYRKIITLNVARSENINNYEVTTLTYLKFEWGLIVLFLEISNILNNILDISGIVDVRVRLNVF